MNNPLVSIIEHMIQRNIVANASSAIFNRQAALSVDRKYTRIESEDCISAPGVLKDSCSLSGICSSKHVLVIMRNKVIGSYISGRLGNQMFQYAFAKALKVAQGGTGQIVLNFKRVHQAGNEEDGFEDTLKYFNVEPYKTEKGNLVLKYCSICQISVYLAFVATLRIFRANYDRERWLSRFRRIGLLYSHYSDNRYSIYENYLQSVVKKKSYICSGKFENPQYFSSIRNILLKEFVPKADPLENNKSLYDIIDKTNSVCVTIRRGDYLEEKFKSKFYVCNEHYFREALKVVKVKIKDPVLIFFSDDIDWVKENIKTDLPSYYESGNDPVWEKLRLMYSCKHYVISNSTFSWWAQYLSRNENKIVISPDRWFNDYKHNGCTYLLSDNFIKVPSRI